MNKIIWGLLTLCYAPFFNKISFPSHIGIPLLTRGLKRVTVGKRVRIMPGARIETYKKGYIIFENNISIGQNFHVTSAGNVIIGSDSTIAGNVYITNIDHEYREIGMHILDQPMIIKNTIIGSNCFIGFGSAIQAGTVLGKQCVVGSNSVVRGVFPDYCVLVGAPARIIKRYNFLTKIWEQTDSMGNFLTSELSAHENQNS